MSDRWDDLPATPRVDGWSAMSHLMAGVLLWGGIGWAAARWLGVPALTGLGIVVGAALGVLLVYVRYGKPRSQPDPAGSGPIDQRQHAPPPSTGDRPEPPSRALEEER